ncbi:MAG: serine hydrolase domain-containing protein, partial [Bacteroidota bacterium]
IYFAQVHTSNTGGVALAFVKNGKVIFQNGYGMANLEYNIPISPNTVFHAASLSKQFTAYSILLLEKQGKLSLEDDVRKYIPEVPDFGKKITLLQLASHTSGLRDQWRLLHLAGWRPDDVILNQDILDLVAQQKDLNFDPGSKLMYSNTGYTLLAEVVARVSGQSFAEFTQEQIFTPLQMTNSQFYDDYHKIVKNRAYSYDNKDGNISKRKLSFSTVGATSLFTTALDMCKWALHLNTLAEKDPKLAGKMSQQAYLNNGEITEAAMGQWTGVKFNGLEWFDHTGSDASFRAYFSRFPESNSAVIVLGNTTPLDARDYGLSVAELFLEELFKEEAKSEKKAKPRKKYKYIRLSPEALNKFCGKYWEPEEFYNREIKVVNDTLIYYRSESSQTKLAPVGNNEFKMLDDPNDVSVYFELNQKNEPTMRLNINDERQVIFLKYQPDIALDAYPGRYYSPELESSIQIQASPKGLQAKVFKG